jgi:thiol-disulfide isomerase/thioredoxin
MMKKRLALIGLSGLLLGVVWSWPSSAAGPAGGADTDPAPVDLSAYQGKVVYVDFWASWCVPCKQSFPWMNSMHRQYGKDGLVIIGVNMDQVRAEADAFLAKYPAEFTIRFDPKGELAPRFKVKGMPTSALLGRDGKVLLIHEGFKNKDPAKLEQAIKDALQ